MKQRILFMWPGHGCSHDSFVFKTSPLPMMLNHFPSKFVLADAGYALSNRSLTPYRGVRYHLKEFDRENGPKDPKELFNLRHSRLRNVIERTIGILKRRWKFLRHGSEILNRPFIYSCFTSCCLLHNFLMNENDFCLDEETDEENGDNENDSDDNDSLYDDDSLILQKQWRDNIAMSMWLSYFK